MIRIPRLAALPAAALLVLGALAGCSTGSADGEAKTGSTSTKAEKGAFPVTVKTALGEATIESEPKRVVTMGYSDADVAISLGVVPVAAEKISWGGTAEGSTPWFDDALAEIEGAEKPKRLDTTEDIPVNDIIKLSPDLVLGTNSGIDQADFDKLTDAGIPVVVYPNAMWTTTWQESLELAGKALGRPTLAKEVAAETTKTLEDTAAKFPQLEGKSFTFGMVDPTDLSTISFYSPEDNRPRILRELGMVDAAFVTKNSKKGEFYFDISAERAADVDADVFLTYATSEKDIETIGSDPLVGSVPAIKANQWFASTKDMDSLGLSSPSPLSLPYSMKHYIPSVAAAADGDGSR
ncbi:iron complex transport system substrate-binding protein [Nocardioides daedukensis]|uniref:Iron complex transport system substrate-binding protein n=1 Tax=Nocardioides daedukensis TaxID=634462 RepID=A0A7Y9UVV6_9ACTN|nr:ABC transporter substrate-binding protein [Nocardioides daedukensis]NYG59190.1 iron complex transport system substrate-binding protein [Nocardioides daedukensis]